MCRTLNIILKTQIYKFIYCKLVLIFIYNNRRIYLYILYDITFTYFNCIIYIYMYAYIYIYIYIYIYMCVLVCVRLCVYVYNI